MSEIFRRNGDRLVGQQRHLRRRGRDLRNEADEPVLGDHGRVLDDALVRPGRDKDLLVVRVRGLSEHARGDSPVVVREARALEELQELAEPLVLLGGGLVLDELLRQLLDAPLELVPLRLRVDEVGGLTVGVLERAGYPLPCNLERREDGQPDTLSGVQPALVRLAEIDGDQDQRDDDQRSGHEPPRHDVLAVARSGPGTRGNAPTRASRAVRCRGTEG